MQNNYDIRVQRKQPLWVTIICIASLLSSLTCAGWLLYDDITSISAGGKTKWDYDHPFWYVFFPSIGSMVIVIIFLLMCTIFRKNFKFYEYAHVKFIYTIATITNVIFGFTSFLFSIMGYGILSIIMYTLVILNFILLIYIGRIEANVEKDTMNALLLRLQKDNEASRDEYKKIYDIYNGVSRLSTDKNKKIKKSKIDITIGDEKIVEPKMIIKNPSNTKATKKGGKDIKKQY